MIKDRGESGIHTLPACQLDLATDKLRRFGIDYHIHTGHCEKIVVFFGFPCSVAVVRHVMKDKKLSDPTPEEDFVLGSMLGYDISKQCDRFLKKIGIWPELQKCA